MPYAPDHRAKTRARVVASARVLFNRHGFEQVTIDAIMEGAGLTRGAFYHHFDSKEELYAEAVLAFRTCSPLSERLRSGALPALDTARLFVDLYLSDGVIADDSLQCPLYALAGDVRRAGDAPRAAYDEMMRGILALLRRALAEQPGLTPDEVEQRAFNVLTLCVGGMLLARTTPSEELSRELRRSAHSRAHALLGATPGR